MFIFLSFSCHVLKASQMIQDITRLVIDLQEPSFIFYNWRSCPQKIDFDFIDVIIICVPNKQHWSLCVFISIHVTSEFFWFQSSSLWLTFFILYLILPAHILYISKNETKKTCCSCMYIKIYFSFLLTCV